MISQTIHIGFDDSDSTRKGCTTYVAALLVEKLPQLGAEFIDYPNLIRLNPNVPWKTRGNGALCLRIRCIERDVDPIKAAVIDTVEEQSDLESRGTDPGIVFFEGVKVPRKLSDFAEKAITGIVCLRNALDLVDETGAEAFGFKNGRGIIGGLAAVGETLQGDHTFEVIAYRVPRNRGLQRKVDEASIFEMDKITAPGTFNNVDADKGRVVITPRGPDPILFGIRGETPEIVKKAFEMVKPYEPVERWVIFRTNQGTDAHLKRIKELSMIRPHCPVIARGTVSENPRMLPGRHIIFPIKDESGQVDCAAYEPTGALRKAAAKLVAGDFVEVHGGVRPPSKHRPLTTNLEKLRLLQLAPVIAYSNPACPQCGKRLKSMGRNQGFRCEKCGSKWPKLEKIQVKIKRDIAKGLYITSTRSQRHLTKPLRRYGLEKRSCQVERLIDGWHFP